MSEWGIGMATLEMTDHGDGRPKSNHIVSSSKVIATVFCQSAIAYRICRRIPNRFSKVRPKTTTNLTDLNSTSIHGEHFLHTIVIDVKLTA